MFFIHILYFLEYKINLTFLFLTNLLSKLFFSVNKKKAYISDFNKGPKKNIMNTIPLKIECEFVHLDVYQKCDIQFFYFFVTNNNIYHGFSNPSVKNSENQLFQNTRVCSFLNWSFPVFFSRKNNLPSKS